MVVDPDAPFVDGKIYVVTVDDREVAALRIFEMGVQLKMVTDDRNVDEHTTERVTIIGRVPWSFRQH